MSKASLFKDVLNILELSKEKIPDLLNRFKKLINNNSADVDAYLQLINHLRRIIDNYLIALNTSISELKVPKERHEFRKPILELKLQFIIDFVKILNDFNLKFTKLISKLEKNNILLEDDKKRVFDKAEELIEIQNHIFEQKKKIEHELNKLN